MTKSTILASLALLNSQLRLERLLPTALDIILELTGADRAFLMLLDQEGKLNITSARNARKQDLRKADFRGSNTILRKVLIDKEALYIPDLEKTQEFASESVLTLNLKSAICIPLWPPQAMPLESVQLLGILYADSCSETQRLRERHLRIIEALGNHLAISIENARLFEELEEKNKQITAQFSAVLEERSRISREIHDTLAQGLIGIILQLEAADGLMADSSEQLHQHVARARETAKSTLLETRQSIWELRPEILENADFQTALAKTAKQILANCSTRVEIDVPETVTLPASIENSLIRITQEALWNITKHASAKTVRIALNLKPDVVRLEIKDDGVGFDEDSLPSAGRFGLIGIRERILKLRGEFTILSRENDGTELIVVIPVPRE
jgi:signal transduction histidine kinase